MMPGHGKSDGPIVPAKPPNKAEPKAAEAVEGRGLAKGNSPERNMLRTQSRKRMSSALERIHQAILWCALVLLPKARAGCSNPARPDLWRGLWVTMIPTPTHAQHERKIINDFNGASVRPDPSTGLGTKGLRGGLP